MYTKIYIIIESSEVQMLKNLKRIMKIKVKRNRIIAVCIFLILCIILIPIIAAFSYSFDTSNFTVPNNIKLSSDIKLIDNIVISDSKDPYYPLAQEIAKSENATLIESIEQLYGYYPKYLI